MNCLIDWLGQNVFPGDHVVYPQRQGSSGAELIVARVLQIEEWDGTGEKPNWVPWSHDTDFAFRVRVQPLKRSRYGMKGDKYRPTWITVTQNLTKVPFDE